LLSDQLASIELDGLEAQFELEDVRICSMSLAKADAGSGRFERVFSRTLNSESPGCEQ
jgi:hypothetical protein